MDDITPSSSSTVCSKCGLAVRPDELRDADQERVAYTDAAGVERVRLQYNHSGDECPEARAQRWNSAHKQTTVIGAK